MQYLQHAQSLEIFERHKPWRHLREVHIWENVSLCEEIKDSLEDRKRM